MATRHQYSALQRPVSNGAFLPPAPDLPEIILTWFIQVTGLGAAIVFGAFAILSWIDSQHAKAQANAANLISIAAICAQVSQHDNGGNEALRALCGPFFSSAWPQLSSAVSDLLPYTPTPTVATTTSTSTVSSSSTFVRSSSAGFPGGASSSAPSSSVFSTSTNNEYSATPSATASPPTTGASAGAGISLSQGQKIGIGVGAGITVVCIIVSSLTVWKTYRRRSQMVAEKEGFGQPNVL